MGFFDFIANIFKTKPATDDMANFSDLPSDEDQEADSSGSDNESGADFDSGDSGSDE